MSDTTDALIGVGVLGVSAAVLAKLIQHTKLKRARTKKKKWY